MLSYFEDEAAKLALLTDRQRLEHIIQRGKQSNGLRRDERIEDNKVEGCQSNAYLVVNVDETVSVKTDADSTVVKGYLAYLSDGFTGETPGAVINEAQESVARFVDDGNLSSTFTPNRSDAFTNTVKAVVKRVKAQR